MKILLISPLPPPVGGIAIWTRNFMKYIENFENEIMITLVNSAPRNYSVTAESPVKRIYCGISTFIRIYLEVRCKIKKENPDVIHLNSSSSLALFKDYFIIKYAKRKNIPVVVHWRFGRITSLEGLKNWEWKMLKINLRNINFSIVLDSGSYQTLKKNGFSNVVNIPNPIAEEVEALSKSLLFSNRPSSKGQLIFVGHIIKSKGVYEMVEACSELNLVSELLLIGPYEDSTKSDLISIAQKRENGLWLRFSGEVNYNQVLCSMQNANILILPSYSEGFPNVVIEAMAMGCTVIASDVGAIPDILAVQTEKPCGVCIPSKNKVKLKEAIEYLLQNPVLLNDISERGIKRVLNHYTLKIVTEKYKTIWKYASSN